MRRIIPRITRTVREDWHYTKRKADRAFHFAENRPFYQFVIIATFLVIVVAVYMQSK